MTEDFVKLSLDELGVIKTALQLLSNKDQKIIEGRIKVSLDRLYNKLQSVSEDIQRTVVEPSTIT
jgi:hypothetical protein